MEQRAVMPSPALLAGEDEGEGTEQLGCGGARALHRRSTTRNPHLNPLPRVVRERGTFHFAVVRCGRLLWQLHRPGPNQPLETTAGTSRAFGSRVLLTRRASAASR